MARYIDADAIHYVEIGKGVEIALASDIDKIPTLSPDEVRGVGEWMLLADQNPEDVKAGNYAYWCSRCYAGDVHAKTQEVPYCWKCGARMKGAEDSE